MKTTRNSSIGIVLFLMIFLSFTAVGKTYGQQGVGISESAIEPHTSAILELSSSARGFLAPRMTTIQRNAIVTPAQGLLVFDTDTKSFWYFDSGDWKAIASTALGSGNQLLGMNAAGTANEYKTLSSNPNITITHTAGNILLNTVQNIQTTDSPIFNLLTLTGLTPNSAVYTDASNTLTSTPPSTGVLGFWNRSSAGLLTPSNAGDNISTTGTLSVGNTTVTGDITVSGTVDGRNVAQDGTHQDNLQTLTGVGAGSVNLGSFAGATISDNATIKSALQQLETSLESHSHTAANIAFTPAGNITSTTVQAAIQELDASVSTSYPALNFAENYLSGNVTLTPFTFSGALTSITLTAGTWLITSETTIICNTVSETPWYATVILGTAATSPYTSGQSSGITGGLVSATTISLSKIITLAAPTTVSVFAVTNEDATVVNALPTVAGTSGTVTAIHAIRVR